MTAAAGILGQDIGPIHVRQTFGARLVWLPMQSGAEPSPHHGTITAIVNTAMAGRVTQGRQEMFNVAMLADANYLARGQELEDRRNERESQIRLRSEAGKSVRHLWKLTSCIFVVFALGLIAGLISSEYFGDKNASIGCGSGLAASFGLYVAAIFGEYKWLIPANGTSPLAPMLQLPQMMQPLIGAADDEA